MPALSNLVRNPFTLKIVTMFYSRVRDSLYKVLIKPLLHFWRKRIAATILNFHIYRPTKTQGGCSVVYIALDKEFGSTVALKVTSFKRSFSKKQFLNEANIAVILSDAKHITTCYNTFIESNHGFIVMELAQTDFHEKYIGKQLESKLLKSLFYQVCLSVADCHKKRVAHLDIKPENLLIDQNGTIKLCDFGSAVLVDKKLPSYVDQFELGSIFYAAPEIRKHPKQIGLEADMWSLGVLLYVLACNTYPFAGKSETEMIENYQKGNLCLLRLESSNMSSWGKNLIRYLLKVDRSQRLTISQVLDHPWLAEVL